MTEIQRQEILWNLLSYAGEGNFAAFDKIVRKVWHINDHTYASRILIYNQMQACQMGGMIEVYETETSLRWSANTSDLGVVLSEHPKQLFRGNQSHSNLHTLITDSNNKSLLIGSPLNGSESSLSAFQFTAESFFNFLPTCAVLMKSIISSEPWIRNPDQIVEFFDFETFCWKETCFQQIGKPRLIRVRGEFSGRIYICVFPDLLQSFRITSPEWAYVIALVLLSCNFRDVFFQEGNCLRINARVKIPGLLKRFLFANSSFVKCGAQIEFHDLPTNCYLRFLNYFGQKA